VASRSDQIQHFHTLEARSRIFQAIARPADRTAPIRLTRTVLHLGIDVLDA